jgi:hypothetical protein
MTYKTNIKEEQEGIEEMHRDETDRTDFIKIVKHP